MTEINFEQLAVNCLINRTDNPSESIAMIDKLEQEYSAEDFITVINYFYEISNNYNVISHLFRKINKYKSSVSVPALIDSLVLKEKYKAKFQDEEIQTLIRISAAKALANIKDNAAVNPLLYCLNNKGENYKLRLSCAEALGKIGDKYAVTPLTEVLKDDNEHSVYLKESAAFALGMIGDEHAVDPLVHILETKKGILDKFTFLKERAIEALSKIKFKSDRVFNALKNSLKDSSEQVRINAIEALSTLEDERVPDALYQCLSDESEEVVRNAIIALYNISGEKVLYDILNDYSLPEQTMKIVKDVIQEIAESDEEDFEEENE